MIAVRYAVVRLEIEVPDEVKDKDKYIEDIIDECDYSFTCKDDNGKERIVDTEWEHTSENY